MNPPRLRLPPGMRLLVPLLLLLLVGGGVLAHAAASARRAVPPPVAPGDTVTIFGPKLMLGGSSGAYHVEQFSVSASANALYELRVVNGNGAGTNRVTGLSLKIDGAQILISDDIVGKNEVVRPVTLAAGTVTLESTVTGTTGSSVSVSVRQMPDPTFEVLQPKRFTRKNGTPAPESYTFTLPPSAGTPYYLKVKNGNSDGTNRVSSATVLLNGVQVLSQNQLNQQVEGFVQVTMQQSNTLYVDIGSSPGSFLEIAGRATDILPPVIQVTSPAPALVTKALQVTAAGTVTDVTATRVTVNGILASRTGAAFTAQVPLSVEGPNTLTYTAVDGAGLRTDSVRTVIRDTEAPVIVINAPANGLLTADTTVTVTGKITDRTAITANLNGIPLTLASDGSFSQVIAVTEGANYLSVTATDVVGNSSTQMREAKRDRTAPVVAFTAPAAGHITNQTSVAVTGTVVDASATTVQVNGVAMTVTNGTFSGTVPLPTEGTQALTATATDAAGNTGNASRSVIRDTQAPQVTVVTPTEGALTNALSVMVTGTVVDSTAVTLTVAGAATPIGSGGSFSAEAALDVEGSNAIALVATDAAGNQSAPVVNVTRDRTAPVVAFTVPAQNAVTNQTSLAVEGTVQDANPISSLEVNGVAMTVTNGTFAGTVPLAQDGANTLTATATDAAGNSGTGARSVIRDTQPPVVAFTAPAEGSITNQASVAVTGTVADASAATVQVNGVAMTVDNGTFSGTVPLPAEGTQALAATATDAAGNTGSASRSVIRDTQAPVVTVITPAEGALTSALAVTVSGTVADSSAVTLTVAGAATPVDGAGAFSAEAALDVDGSNAIALVATDAAGNQSAPVVTVIRDRTAPVVAFTTPAEGAVTSQTSLAVEGTVQDASPIASVEVNGVAMTVTNGTFSGTVAISQDGANTLTATATDAAGNSGTGARSVVRDSEAPVVAFTTPAEGAVTSQTSLAVEGTVQDASPIASLEVNGVAMTVTNGTFAGTVPLAQDGENALTATATDAAGNSGTAARSVIRDTQAPVVAFTTPAEGQLTNQTSIAVTGTVQDASATTVQVNGVEMTVADGAFSGTVPLSAEGANTLTATATDAVGNTGTASRPVVRDTEAPVVVFTTPAEGAVTSQTSLAVEGTVQDASPIASVQVNGVAMTVTNGTFSGTVGISQDGANTLTATATDAAGNSGTGERSVIRDSEPPVVAFTSPAEGSITNQTSVAVTGTVQDASTTTVTVNGVSMTVTDGTFSGTVPLPAEGTQALAATATDAVGNTGNASRSVIRDTQAPLVTVLTPAEGALTKESLVTVTGTVLDSTAVTLTVAGAATPVSSAGEFASDVALSVEGANPIALVATDAAGNQSAPIVGVTRDTEAPVITWTTPEEGLSTPDETVTHTGTITDASEVTATLNGSPLTLGAGGAFSVPANLVEGANSFSIAATDAAGNAASAARSVTRALPSNLPPDPATVAPVLDRTVATNVGAATEFLYTGTSPIQTGVAPGTIDVIRAAGLRGRVVNRDLQPLPGVTVTVRDHPEYGQTLTRADGRFDLVVNGGGPVRIDFDKASYLPAQRQTNAPWLDWVVLDDVILLQLDPVATPVTLGSSEAQVVRGSVVEDADGPRQATLVIPAGTTATIQLPDGTTQPATNLTLRATEFTVGENGPAAMPGILPATSAYTYAAQLSVDGLPAGADVVFSTPVPFYVENFLDFPVGTPVPTGTWDPARGVWVPTTDGRIIAIVSTTGGIAEIDVTGDGVADSPTVLAQQGITTAERQQLAATYTPGTQLQRTPIVRSIGFDLNYPHNVQGADPQGSAAGQCEPGSGAAALCTAQTASQRVGLPGTEYDMSYTSARTAGNEANRTLEVDLTGATLPAELRRVDLEVTVAGRKITESFVPAPNLRHTFVWDGKDAYGRTVQGVQPVSVRIGHVYPVRYYIPATTARSFGLSCTGSGTDIRVACEIPADVDSRARQETTRWQTLPAVLGTHDAAAQAMGGWTLGIHHAYDPATHLLYAGDGTTRGGAQAVKTALRTAAGNGTSGFAGDGGPAMAARLWGMEDMRSAPNGDLYIADYGNHRIRKISRNGIITTVAGGGTGLDGGPALGARLSYPHGVWLTRDGGLLIAEEGGQRIRRIGTDGVIRTIAGTGVGGYTGDGGPATAAQVNTPRYVIEAPDGSIYFSQKGNHVVRRIMPDGTIVTVAGTGTAGLSGDGGVGTRAALNQPDGIAIGADGSLYIADQLNNRVRRVAPSGQISTVAGTGTAGFLGDNGPATAARLNRPQGLEVAADGSLYIADSNNNRVRRVSPGGVITTVAGTGTAGSSPEGGPAADSRLRVPRGVSRGPDGSMYVADFGNNRVRRIAPAFPGLTGDEMGITSGDGAEIYIFNAAGRHLRTQAAATGDTVFVFGYDAGGRLTTVANRDKRVTTLERDGTGAVTAVTGPDGIRTALDVGAGGNLESLALPGGATVHYTYGDGGLLTGLSDGNGNDTYYDYDAQGRVVGQRRADGSSLALSRTATASGSRVAWTTGDGLTTSVGVAPVVGGGSQRTVVLPNGEGVVTTTTPDGRTTSTAPNGMSTTVRLLPDPRAGMQAPLDETITRTPAGLQRTERKGRALVLDPLTNVVLTQTDSLVVNGRASLETYDRAAGKVTRVSAAGRRGVITLDAEGRMVGQTAGGMEPVTNTYDPAGRLVGSAQGSRTQSYVYDAQGRLVSATDALGRTAGTEYDAAGRITRRTLYDGRMVQFGYDANGNLTSVTPPSRPAHRFGLTAGNLDSTYTAPDAGAGTAVTQMIYDTDRRLERILRPGGVTVQMAYDSVGRRSSLTLPGEVVTFGYDPQTGQTKTIAGLSGTTLAYAYDGDLLTGTTWSGPVAASLGWRYDNDFRVVAETVNGADSVRFAYDADGLITGAGALSIQRGAEHGLAVGTSLGQVTTAQGYSAFGERAWTHALFGADTLFRTSYTRDALGRITALSEKVGAQVTTYAFAYDSAGRLATVTRDGQPFRAYEYDANSNRVREVNPSGVVDGSADVQDRLLSWGGAAYAYTADGDLSARVVGADTTRYRYDALGNLREVALPGGTLVEYVVDGAGRRVGVKTNGQLQRAFLWQDGMKVSAELNAQGQVVTRFVYGERPNVPEYMVRGGTTYRLVHDHLGSVRMVVNVQTGAVAQRLDYDPWGRVLLDSNPGFQPFGYAGGLYDERTGLVRYQARDYDAQTGRWTTRDPSLFEGGDSNLYGYTLQDPVNGFDPTGEYTLAEHWASMNGWAGLRMQAGIGAGWGCATGIMSHMIAADKKRSLVEDCTVNAVVGAVGNVIGGYFAGSLVRSQFKLNLVPTPLLKALDNAEGIANLAAGCIVGVASEGAKAGWEEHRGRSGAAAFEGAWKGIFGSCAGGYFGKLQNPFAAAVAGAIGGWNVEMALTLAEMMGDQAF